MLKQLTYFKQVNVCFWQTMPFQGVITQTNQGFLMSTLKKISILDYFYLKMNTSNFIYI